MLSKAVISTFGKTKDHGKLLAICFLQKNIDSFLTSISAAVSGKIAHTGKKKKKKLRHHHVIFHGLYSYRLWLSTNQRASCIHRINSFPVRESEGNKFWYPVDGDLSSHTVIQRLNNWALVAENMMYVL